MTPARLAPACQGGRTASASRGNSRATGAATVSSRCKRNHPIGVELCNVVEPSPCPRCSGVRRWKDVAGGAVVVAPVSCTGCDRLATACTRCGWEYSGRSLDAGGAPDADQPNPCVSCVVVELAGRPRTPKAVVATGAPGATEHRAQHDADTLETLHRAWFSTHRTFADTVDEAMRRAIARARLE